MTAAVVCCEMEDKACPDPKPNQEGGGGVGDCLYLPLFLVRVFLAHLMGLGSGLASGFRVRVIGLGLASGSRFMNRGQFSSLGWGQRRPIMSGHPHRV